MKKVLWISRYPIDGGAIDDLGEEFGDIHIETAPILFPNSGEEAYEILKEEAKNYDVVGFVPPAQLTAELLRKVGSNEKIGKKGFFAISKPAPAGPDGIRRFEYDHVEIFDI
jgi:hypothetical protein